MLYALALCGTVGITDGISWIETEGISSASIIAWERRYFNRTVILDCFTRYNEISVNFDAQRLCVTLYPTYNKACDVVFGGIYLDLEFDNLRPNTTRARYADYVYAHTTELCMECPRDYGAVDSLPDCFLVQQALFASVHIRTLEHALPLVIGRMQIAHSDLAQCFSAAHNYMYLGAQTAVLHVKTTFLCDRVISQCQKQFYAVTLRFEVQESVFDDENQQNASKQTIIVNAGPEFAETSVDVEQQEEWHIFTITADFAKALLTHPQNIEIELFSQCGSENVAVAMLTVCNRVLSREIPQIMLKPTLRIWPGEITLQAEPLADAAQLDAQTADRDTVWVRLRFQSKISGLLVADFATQAGEFSFLGIAQRVIDCRTVQNSADCYATIELLGGADISVLECIIAYYFEKSGEIAHFATQMITDIELTCWKRIDATYRHGSVCLRLESNADRSKCPISGSVRTQFILTFNETFSMSQTSDYDVSQEDLCVQCIDGPECAKTLVRHWRFKSRIDLDIISEYAQIRNVSIQHIYNSNYMQLFSLAFYYAIAVFITGMAVFFTYYLLFTQKCRVRCRRRAGKRPMCQLDEM